MERKKTKSFSKRLSLSVRFHLECCDWGRTVCWGLKWYTTNIYIHTFIHSFIYTDQQKKTRKIKIKKEANRGMRNTEVEDELWTCGTTRISTKQKKKNSPKKNVSFMCVQNVDNIGLDGNKNGQANKRKRKRERGWVCEWSGMREICKNWINARIFSQHVVSCLTLINRKFFIVKKGKLYECECECECEYECDCVLRGLEGAKMLIDGRIAGDDGNYDNVNVL